MKKVFFLAYFFVIFFSIVNFTFAEPTEFTIQMAAKMVYGKTSEDIKFLQKNLYDFGYFKVDVTEPVFSGKFDNELKLALVDFQKTNEIKVTGVVDPTTVKTLNDFLKYVSEDEGDTNQYLSKDGGIDNYGGGIDNYGNGVDDYKETMNYKTDYSDYYSNIPLIKDAVDIISPVKSSDETTLYLSDEEDSYYFQGTFNFFDCLTDKRCIDLEEIYENE